MTGELEQGADRRDCDGRLDGGGEVRETLGTRNPRCNNHLKRF